MHEHEDDTTITDHITVMKAELKKSKPNVTIICERMQRTFNHCRRIINSSAYQQKRISAAEVMCDFGNNLKLAKERFQLEKRMLKFSQKWAEWIMTNATISPSYARKIMQIAELAGKYPRLQKLAFTFKQLYQMRNKIADIFAKNEHISQQWK